MRIEGRLLLGVGAGYMLPNDEYTVCEPIYSWRRTIVPRENVPFMAARNDQYLFPGEGGSMFT